MTPEQCDDYDELAASGKLRLWRALSGVSLLELTARLGVSHPTLLRWEKGRSQTPAEKFVRYYELVCEWRTKYGDITVVEAQSVPFSWPKRSRR